LGERPNKFLRRGNLLSLKVKPGAEFFPLRGCHTRLIAEWHGIRLDRLNADKASVLAQVGKRLKAHVFWRVGETGMLRSTRMAVRAVVGYDLQHLGVGD
jgi:hypothetical protein